MAAPPEKSLAKLTGQWRLNKPLSADVAKILALQGTSSMVCKVIASASITLTVFQPRDNEYSIKQTATTAAIPGTTEQYILDFEWRTNKDPFFGEVRGRSKWISLEEANRMDIEGDWEDSDQGRLLLAEGGKEDGDWEAQRLWGFEQIEGQRRWTQTVKLWNKDGEDMKGKMVYDFIKE